MGRGASATKVHLVHVAQNRVALEQQTLELPSVEDAELVLDLLDPLCITPILGPGDLVDRDEIPGRAGDESIFQ